MNYRSEIAELSKFFSTVKSIRDKYVREFHSLFLNQNIQELIDYYYIDFVTPKYFIKIQRQINIVEIDHYSESLNNYNKDIDIYSLRNEVLHEKGNIPLYVLTEHLLFIVNLVLNYAKLKYALSQKDWRIIAKFMNMFFGDIK